MDEKREISRVEVPGGGSIGIIGDIINSKLEIHINNSSDAKLFAPSVNIQTSIPVPDVFWPNPLGEHAPDLANRDQEFGFFRDLIANKTNERALFIEAPGNRGKTTLLHACKKYAESILYVESCVTIDFKATPSQYGVMDTLRLELGKVVPNLGRSNSSPYDLRAGLRELSKPIIFFFDTYEKASPDARELLVLPLINDLSKLVAVRVVIAGKEVPDHNNSTWQQSVRHFTLEPIHNASNWERIIKKHYPLLNSDHVQALTLAAKGEPGTIRAFLQAVNGALSTNH